MTTKKSSSSDAACVLDCGGCDAAFPNFHWASVPRLPKAIEAYSNLLKGIFKKLFFSDTLKSEPLDLKISILLNSIQGHSSLFKTPSGEKVRMRFCQLTPAYAKLCQPMPSYASLCQLP